MSRLAILTALVFVAHPLYAYIDPGAGSIILQIVLGGLAGLGVAWKLLWHRLRGKNSERPD